MALDYKKKSEYWDQKRKDATTPKKRRDRPTVEVSTSVPKEMLVADESERVTLRAKSKYPEMTQKPTRSAIQIKKRESRPTAAKRREGFEIVPDAPTVEHEADPIRAQERRKVSKKRVERQRRVQRSNIRTFVTIIVSGLLLAALLGSLVAFLRSPYFAIDTYTVKGTDNLTSGHVLSYLTTDERTSILPLKTKEIEEALLVNPWIAQAQIKKKLPSSLEITITEREPIAVVSMVSGESWIIASDGIWLGKLLASTEATAATDPAGEHPVVTITHGELILIEDISPVENTFGLVATSEEVINAIEVINGLDPALLDQVQSISAPEIPLTKIITTDHVEILVGSSKDIRDKSQVALRLLRENEGKVTLINVRGGKSSIRGLVEDPE